MNGVDIRNFTDFGQIGLTRQRQHLRHHGRVQSVIGQHCPQGFYQALIKHQRLTALNLSNQLLQHLHGQLLPGFPAVEAVTVVLHQEHQLVTAVGEAQLDRGREAAQQGG